MLNPQKNRVLVALGGKSSEREVSIASGRAVATALERQGYSVDLIDFGTGRFLQLPELDNIEKDSNKLPRAVNYPFVDIVRHFEVVFIAMHGKFGEDGLLQGLFEEIGIKYVGSRPVSSAVALDKKFSKQIMEKAQIPTPEWEVLKAENEKTKMHFPVVVKPADQGSSIGVSICENNADFELGKKEAFKYSESIIIEKYLGNREISVPILEKEPGQPQALPVIEIIPKQKFFSYEAKYSGETQEIVPARISKELTQKAQELALKTHLAHDCRHFSRVDMIVDKANKVWILEINTIPGLTPESLFPKSANAAGFEFNRLIAHLVKIALK